MSDETRDRLLEVAREILVNRGYVGLTVKAAAAAAGVTPEVARRYYNNRDALFAAALRLPVSPATALPALIAPGLEGIGERLVRFTLDLLSDANARNELLSLMRTGVVAGQASAGIQELIEHAILDRVTAMMGVPDARMRASLASSYLIGVAMGRYALRIEPLASASEEDVVRMVAPTIQDLLDPRKPLPGSRSATPTTGSAPTPAHAGGTGVAASRTGPRRPAAGTEPTPAPDEEEPPTRPTPRRARTFDPDPAATAARRASETKHGQD